MVRFFLFASPVYASSAQECRNGGWLSIAGVLVFLVMAVPGYGQQESNGEASRAAVTPAMPLEGLRFSAGIVRAADDGSGSEPLPDVLIFKDGQFSSEVCKRYNFPSAPYWIRRNGNQVLFRAELTSPTDGTMVWNGSVVNGKLEGTMRWTRKRWYWTIDAEHQIRGELDGFPKQAAAD